MNSIRWKSVKGYEGRYEISDTGSVKSCARIMKNGKLGTHLSTEVFLKQRKQNGYYSVALYKNNKSKRFYVHRLVAAAFINNPKNKMIVNHINGDRLNNIANNLEWVNAKEHTLHGIDIGQIPKFAITYEELEELYTYNKKSISEIAKLKGVSPSTISIRLNKYGIKKRSLSEQATKYDIKPETIIQGLKTMTQKELSRKIGCNKALISLKVKELKEKGYFIETEREN